MKTIRNQNNEEVRTDNKRKDDQLSKNYNQTHPLKTEQDGNLGKQTVNSKKPNKEV